MGFAAVVGGVAGGYALHADYKKELREAVKEMERRSMEQSKDLKEMKELLKEMKELNCKRWW
jgi:pentatricopeptide repeat protein